MHKDKKPDLCGDCGKRKRKRFVCAGCKNVFNVKEELEDLGMVPEIQQPGVAMEIDQASSPEVGHQIISVKKEEDSPEKLQSIPDNVTKGNSTQIILNNPEQQTEMVSSEDEDCRILYEFKRKKETRVFNNEQQVDSDASNNTGESRIQCKSVAHFEKTKTKRKDYKSTKSIRHQCKMCDASLSLRQSLKMHMNMVHNEKQYRSDKCKKSLDGDFIKHHRSHTRDCRGAMNNKGSLSLGVDVVY